MMPKDFVRRVEDEELKRAATCAAEEDRLFFVVGDQYGRPCNGGTQQDAPLVIGEWTPEVGEVSICERGYHATTDPLRWRGCTLWLAELRRVVAWQDDKVVGPARRTLMQIFPWFCDDSPRLWTAASRPFLSHADLTAANLRCANLSGANLHHANLTNANLSDANLTHANLRFAWYDDATVFPAGFDPDAVGMRRAC